MELAHELFRCNSHGQGPGACSLGSLLSGCRFSELQGPGEFYTILSKGEAGADLCLRSQVVWTGTILPGNSSLHSTSVLERAHWNSWKTDLAVELIVRMSRYPVLEPGLWYSFISLCKEAAYHPGIPPEPGLSHSEAREPLGKHRYLLYLEISPFLPLWSVRSHPPGGFGMPIARRK